MPQNALQAYIAKNLSNALVALLTDAQNALRVSTGGIGSSLNVTAAAAIKGSAGRLAKITVLVAGSAGSLTINDSATTGGAATANQIMTIAYGSLTVGQVITLDWPCANGITISAVPTGGAFSVSYS